jgi:hypothetical protein
MFPKQRITGVRDGRIKTDIGAGPGVSAYASKRQYSENQVTASLGSGLGGGGAGGNSLSINSFWNSQYQYFFTGLIPAEPMYSQAAQLALLPRHLLER